MNCKNCEPVEPLKAGGFIMQRRNTDPLVQNFSHCKIRAEVSSRRSRRVAMSASLPLRGGFLAKSASDAELN
jgi:hypothetical protein